MRVSYLYHPCYVNSVCVSVYVCVCVWRNKEYATYFLTLWFVFCRDYGRRDTVLPLRVCYNFSFRHMPHLREWGRGYSRVRLYAVFAFTLHWRVCTTLKPYSSFMRGGFMDAHKKTFCIKINLTAIYYFITIAKV